jgi:hypothetical protein
MPNVKLPTLGPLQINESDRATTAKAIRPLWLEMSRRRVLTDEGADENMGAMQASAETLIQHVHTARLGLPDDSPVDVLLEELQDALEPIPHRSREPRVAGLPRRAAKPS